MTDPSELPASTQSTSEEPSTKTDQTSPQYYEYDSDFSCFANEDRNS